MAASLSHEQALQTELDRISVEARAFEGAYKKMKAERDKLLNELQDANKQIRYTVQKKILRGHEGFSHHSNAWCISH